MTEPMEVLYAYAQEHMLYALLARESGYRDAMLHAGRQEKQIRTLMDGIGLEHLDAMLEEQKLCDFYRGQALFRAGFSLAVELMRE